MSHLILLLALYQSSTTLGWLLPPAVPHTFLNKLSAIPRGDSIPTSDYTVEEQTALLDDMEEVSMEELEGPKVDSSQYMLGDTDGLEDPIDAPWRIKAEGLINSAAFEQSITIQDITWKFCVLTITTQGGLDADQIQALHLRINELLEEQEDELQVLRRHDIEIGTPGSSDVLTTQGQFDTYKGFEVDVQTEDPFKSNRVITGTLHSRDALNVKINQKGRIVTIPNEMVKEIKLPKAKKEKL